jgi:arylsulfatase A
MMTISRRSLLMGLLAPRRQPNIVLILADDLGWADLGCYGSTYHETPNLDRMASNGLRFTDAYAACAVCSPSRAALLTGRYPTRHGMTTYLRSNPRPGQPVEGHQTTSKRKLLEPLNKNWMERDEVTIAESLKQRGYVSANIGKWHLGPEHYYPQDQGFDYNLGGLEIGAPPSYFDPYKHRLPNLPSRRPGEYLTYRLADEATAFIRKHKTDPFFLYLSHYAVHAPLQAEDDTIRKYKGKRTNRQKNPTYAAMVESLDTAVGRVMAELKEQGLADNTLVIFTSDNGGVDADANEHPRDYYTSNYPLRAGKCWPYEGGVRVPAIVYWPGHVKAGSICHEPVTGVDWMPTVCEAANVPLPPGRPIDGLSVMPLFRGGGHLRRNGIYWHFPHYQHVTPNSAIRDGDWKLIRFYETGKSELYNLRTDIGEQRDLAALHPARVRALNGKLDAWLKETGAKLPIKNPATETATRP